VGSDAWVPEGVDTERPSAARIYDYWLGGAHNFAVDRQLAERLITADPDGPKMAWANRELGTICVLYLACSEP
jgi:hypothetical protein